MNDKQSPPPSKAVIVVYNQGISSVGVLRKPPALPVSLECGANLVPVATWEMMKKHEPLAAHLTIPASVMPPAQPNEMTKSLVEGATLPEGFAGAKQDQALEIVKAIKFVPLLKQLDKNETRPTVQTAIRDRIEAVEAKVRRSVAA